MKTKQLVAIATAAFLLTACSCNSKVVGGSRSATSSAQQSSAIAGDYNFSLTTQKLNSELQSSVGNTVLFAFDRSSLTNEAMATLDAQAEFIKRNSRYSFIIEGHTDERGTRIYNMALGERRAHAAQKYLLSKGVDESRIKVVSYGKEKPATVGHDEAAWRQNRRSVTVVVEAGRSAK